MSLTQGTNSKHYYTIEHIAKAIHPRAGWGDQLMALLTVYADASGHESDQPDVIVGGWISTVDEWMKLESKWRCYLADRCHTECFHMTDFIANRGDFADWRERENEREGFLDGLADLIFAHTFASFSVTVHSELYKEATAEYSLDDWLGNAYAFAGRMVATLVKVWTIKTLPQSWPARFVFEKGDAGQDELFSIMRRDEYPTPNFEGKCSVAGLQAADVLAWEIRQDQLIRRRTGGAKNSGRPLFQRFLGQSNGNWRSFDKNSFDAMGEQFPLAEEFETLLNFKRRIRREKKEKGDTQ